MFLKKIHLINFKNFSILENEFSPSINCIVGKNGIGKTNILDAINYLSLTKSAFSYSDQQTVKHGEFFFSILGTVEGIKEFSTIQLIYKNKEKKIIKHDESVCAKSSLHIGKMPSVLISPDDTDIIKESSEERRKFFDSILAQIDQVYLHQLIDCNRLLKQRNALLKNSEFSIIDYELIETYDYQLITLFISIGKFRKKFISQFLNVFNEHYNILSSSAEKVGINYLSETENNDFEKIYRSFLKEDILTQRTKIGVHRDDYEFTLNNFPLRKFGSQGQQKSFIIALKTAMAEILHQKTTIQPIMLWDDIFDKLDDKRIENLLSIYDRTFAGQLFITDARPDRTKMILKSWSKEYKLIQL